MLLFVITALFYYCMGANSAPLDCPLARCKVAIRDIWHNLNESKISGWDTYAANETDWCSVKCNLEIFKEDFERQLNVNCNTAENRNTPQCLIYKGLECLPKHCKIPGEDCTAAPKSIKANITKSLERFIGTVIREQNSSRPCPNRTDMPISTSSMI